MLFDCLRIAAVECVHHRLDPRRDEHLRRLGRARRHALDLVRLVPLEPRQHMIREISPRVAAAPAGLIVLYPAVLWAAAVPQFTLPVLLIVPPSVPRRGRRFPPGRWSLRPKCRGSALAWPAQTESMRICNGAAKFASCCGPISCLPCFGQDFYHRAFAEPVARLRVGYHYVSISPAHDGTLTRWTDSLMGCEHIHIFS